MGRRERRKDERETKKSLKHFNAVLDQAADRQATSFGAYVDQLKAEAEEDGQHGVMIIGTGESAHICELVPPGKVWVAGSQEAHDKRLAEQGDS